MPYENNSSWVFRLKIATQPLYAEIKQRLTSDQDALGVDMVSFDDRACMVKVNAGFQEFFSFFAPDEKEDDYKEHPLFSNLPADIDLSAAAFMTLNNNHDLIRVMFNQKRYKRWQKSAHKYMSDKSRYLPAEPATKKQSYRSIVESFTQAAQPRLLVLGEYHTDSASKRALIDHMADYKAAGVALLYELFPQSLQTDIDGYTRGSTEMSAALDGYLAALDEQWELKPPYRYRDVFDAARLHGVRIIAGESVFSYEAETFGAYAPMDGVGIELDKDDGHRYNWFDRIALYNEAAGRLLDTYLKANPDKKVIAVMGADHALPFEDEQSGLSVAGIANAYESTAVIVVDDQSELHGHGWIQAYLP